MKFSGFFALIDSRSHAKNWGEPSSDFEGGGGKEKSLPPIFSPLGGPRALKFLGLRGPVGRYLNSKFDVPPIKIGVRGRGEPFKKNFIR